MLLHVSGVGISDNNAFLGKEKPPRVLYLGSLGVMQASVSPDLRGGWSLHLTTSAHKDVPWSWGLGKEQLFLKIPES
jgi:hypothetical protein